MTAKVIADASMQSSASDNGNNRNDTTIGETVNRSTPKFPPDWWGDAIQRLHALLLMPENWDSYGAAAPDPNIVASGVGFLKFVVQQTNMAPPEISANRTGGVFFEWGGDDEHELEVDVVSPYAAEYLYENTKTGELISGSLFQDDANDGRFLEILREYFAE